MKKIVYDNGESFVVPESPLEVDVVRQTILPDKWDLVSEPPSESDRHYGGLTWRVGGQVVFDPEWSSHLLIHYRLGERSGNGAFFDLTVSLHERPGASKIGTFQLLAALRVFSTPHDFQCNFRDMKRTAFFVPWWILLPDRVSPVGVSPRNIDQRITRYFVPLGIKGSLGSLMPPHIELIDPANFRA